ncbi:MAG: amidophosphoribosyltransferase [Candidatus Eremiobacteraeota bacterium]|nr:amidophosphoribosyltransferase [Candidatus Eremiobacteraeota bacterium]MBV8721127.1 amidophosphoribosyltransferase [Candidatus Eremiobacteraeota bacterium]
MCGITGVFAPGRDAARLAYFALYALQHRGQESAGIAAADGGTIRSHKAMGLLSAIFDEDILSDLSGHIAVGHTRYSTTGSSIVVNAQPLLERTELGDFAFAHNGNLTNTDDLRATLSPTTVLQATSDSEVMAKLIVESKGTMLDRIAAVLKVARGAYSIVLCTQDELYAFRDPWGVRPLCIGTLPDGGYIVASESCAFGPVGAQYLREVERGEILRITGKGLESHRTSVESAIPALCMFEYIYFSRPDSKLDERSIYMARYAMGRQLAKEHPIEADVVMAVPDSAVAGGIGYAAESGLPYVEGLIKNRYIGRTFISPDQKMRSRGVHLKFNPVVENLRGQRVVVVDDSIVRGTTTPRIVALLREAGAREVHLRITSPPIKHPCYLGVDMATYDELIAANYTVEEIRAKTGADSLGYLSLAGLMTAIGREREEMCVGCLTGEYPNVPATHQTRVLAKAEI